MLKGNVTFELKDVKTGEVERISDHNMFTNALNELFNKTPYGFMNDLCGQPTGTGVAMHPIFKTALGGLLLFPKQIEENANNIFATPDNKPVGLASVLDNPNTDPRRGSFNAIESGEITNGYRYVYDFSTSQANGTIACCSLTSAWGGASFIDNIQNLLCGLPVASEYSPHGFYKMVKDAENTKHKIIGCNSRGIYFLGVDYKTILVLPVRPHSFSLIKDYNTLFTVGTMSDQGYVFVTSTHVCCLRTAGNASGNATINIDKYSIDDFSKETVTYVVAASLKNPTLNETRGHTIAYDEENDYLYCLGYDGVSFYRIKLSNLADVTRIEVPSANSDLGNCKPYFVGQNFIIEEDGTVHNSPVAMHNACMCRDGLFLFGGAWNWGTNSSSYQTIIKNISCNPIGNYLATIMNLKNSVIKSPDKTMKVTYDVTYEP